MNLSSSLAILLACLASSETNAFSIGADRRKSFTVSTPGSQSAVFASTEFKNDGPFSFMEEALGVGGITEGKKIVWGVLTEEVGEKVPEDTASKLREEAAQNLTNIDEEERDRRDRAGSVIYAITAVFALYLSIFVDQGDFAGHLMRFSVFPFFSLGYGYKQSAKEGL